MTTERGSLGAPSNNDNYIRCPHSIGTNAPACWDCTEKGRHVDLGSAGMSPESPESWTGSIKESWTFAAGNRTTEQPDPTLEVHHPEPGLELDKSPHTRWSQPGLEVSSGPMLMSNAEKQEAVKAGAVYKHGQVVSDEKEPVKECPSRKTIWGIQRRVCFLFLVVVVLIVVAAVTLGVVLGLKQNKGSGDSSGPISPSTNGNNNNHIPPATSLIQPQPQPSTMERAQSFSATSRQSSATALVESSTIKPSPSLSAAAAPPTHSPSTTTQVAKTSTKEKPSSSTTTDPEPTTTEQPQYSTIIKTQPTTVIQQEPTTIIQQQPTTIIQSQPKSSPTSTTTTAPATPTSASNEDSDSDSDSDPVPECPDADGTTYTDPATGTKFKRTCYVQHPGYDIENEEKESMADCMAWCASVTECKGAQWYNAGPQGTDLNYCWLKYDMTGEIRETKDAQSAVIID